MTRHEVADLVRRISAFYPRWPIGTAALDDWADDLAEVPAERAAAAWRRWRQPDSEGRVREFPPTSGDLLARVEAARPVDGSFRPS